MLQIEDDLAAYLFDGAVSTFGIIVENALYEREEIGTGKEKRSEPKYTLKQILSDGFTLPHPARSRKAAAGGRGGLQAKLRSVFGGGFKVWKEQEILDTNGENIDTNSTKKAE